MNEITQLHAVAAEPSKELTETLEALLEAAREGHLVGMCFVGLLKQRKFVIDVLGEAASDPTFSRGMVLTLDDELREMVHSQTRALEDARP